MPRVMGFPTCFISPFFSWCLTLVVSQWPRLCVDGVKVAVRLGALGVVNPKIGWIWKSVSQGVKRRIPQLLPGFLRQRKYIMSFLLGVKLWAIFVN